MNRVFLVGRLGQDPVARTTANQTAVVNLNVATSEKRKDANGNMTEETEWHKIVVWDKQAENVNKYLRKGSKVLIEGKITTRCYEKDGKKQYSTEIVASNVQFLDGKDDKAPAKREEARHSAGHEFDSIPF